MAIFKKVKIKDIANINPDSVGRDFKFETIKYVDISSVGIGNITEFQEMNIEDAPSRAKRLVKSGDTILSTVRPNRRSFFYFKKPEENTVVSTGFAVLRALENNSPRYLYYSVTDQSFTKYLTKNAKGSAYPAVDADIIYDGAVFIPKKIEDQSRIASFLSTYDDLIENNEKRIMALEEMAQLLYTEWFVKLKFPGHEKVEMVYSGTEYGMVPEGWEVKKILDICVIKYGKNLPTTNLLEDGKYSVYGAAKIIGKYNKYNKENPTVITGCRGSVGKITITEPFSFITNNSFTFDFVEEEEFFFYYQLIKRGLKDVISGSAQPQITIDSISSVKLFVPTKKLIKDFNEKINSARELIYKLQVKNKILSQTRDLLIPQLVTGKRELK